MRLSRKVLSLAVLVGGVYALQPTTAQAAGNGKFHALAVSARQATTGFSPDLGFGSIPLPLNPAAVRAFDRNLQTGIKFFKRTGRLYPETPALQNFAQTGNASPALLTRIQNREAFSLELARERALRRPDDTYGGIQFTPPTGTPYAPVSNLNLFTFLPVFRASQGLP
jgi:hypothetical protein